MKYMKPLKLVQEVVKSNVVERGLLLGLDVGERYVGLAVSDRSCQIASPLSVLVRKEDNIDMMAIDFQKLISELPVSALIIGCPLTRLKNSPDAVQVKVFIDDLHNTGKLDGFRYTFWNESYTSKDVEFTLKHLNLHPSLAKTISDKFAAVNILQLEVLELQQNDIRYLFHSCPIEGYLDFANKHTESNSDTDSDSE